MGSGSTEKRGLRLDYRPDCHLAQMGWRKGARESVLHCDGNLKGLTAIEKWRVLFLSLILSLCKNKDNELYTSLQFSLEEQSRQIQQLSLILLEITKTTSPTPLFDSLWKNKRQDLFLFSILFEITKTTSPTPLFDSLWKNRDDKFYISLLFSLEEQRRQVLHLSSILFGRTETTSSTSFFYSLWKSRGNKFYTSLWFSLEE